MDSSSNKSEEEDNRDTLSSQIIDYYKKYAQNKQLPKYFSGSSLSYMPQVIVSSGDEHDVNNPTDETKSETLVKKRDDTSQTDVEEGEACNKPISPASSVTSNRKLEWDNGADIGYTNWDKDKDKSLYKSLSLPILSLQEDNPVLKPQVLLVSYPSSSTEESAELKKESVPSTSSSSNSKPQVSSTSTSSSGGATQKSLTSPSGSSSLGFLKRKIGSPDAESTPKLDYHETPLTRIERNPRKIDMKRKIVKLCLTKPITVECIGDMKSTNKKIQTSIGQSSKCVQTGDSLMKDDPIRIERPQDNRSVVIINCDSNTTSLDTQTNSDVVDCDSFEYLIGEDVEEQSKTPESSGNGPKSDPVSSSETSKDTPLLGELIGSKNLAADVDRSIGLLQKLMKSKRYDPATKKRYIKKIVQRIVDSKYEEDSSNSTDVSHKVGKLQENVPWFPVRGGKFSVKTFSDEFVPPETKKATSDGNNRKARSIFTMNDNPGASTVANAPTSLEMHRMSSSSSSYNSWKEDKTLSERLLERRMDQGQGDRLVDFAVKERRNQISWISNEIGHLSKLKNLLQKNFNGRGIRKTTTVYMVSQKYGSGSPKSSSTGKSDSSARNYVIETELGSNSTSDRFDFRGRNVQGRNRMTTGDIEVTSDDKTTNIRIKARTDGNGPSDEAFFTLRQPQLVGHGTYPPRITKVDSDKCWPCGMPIKNPRQFTVDIPLYARQSKDDNEEGKFSTTSSQYEATNKVCSEGTQCKIGCKCKEKCTQSRDSKTRPAKNSETQQAKPPPKFCYCEGVQTDADSPEKSSTHKKNQEAEQLKKWCYCEGVQTDLDPAKTQEKSVDKPKFCYCEGVQTLSGQKTSSKPQFCYCEGVQTSEVRKNDRNRGIQSDASRKPRFCYCEGVQTAEAEKFDRNQGIQSDGATSKPRFCYCEGVQTSAVPKSDRNRGIQSGDDGTKSKICCCESVQTLLDRNNQAVQAETGSKSTPSYSERIQTEDERAIPKHGKGVQSAEVGSKLGYARISEHVQTTASGSKLDYQDGGPARYVQTTGFGSKLGFGGTGQNVQTEFGSKFGFLGYGQSVQTADDKKNGVSLGKKKSSGSSLSKEKPPSFHHCEGVQTNQDIRPGSVQTEKPVGGSGENRGSQWEEMARKLARSSQSDERPTTSQGIQLLPETINREQQLPRIDSERLIKNYGSFEGVALKGCLCTVREENSCICVDASTQANGEGPKKKCVCSELVQTGKLSTVDDKLQTNRIKTGDEINQTFGLHPVTNKVLQTKSPDIADERAQTDRAKIADRKEQTERLGSLDGNSQTVQVKSVNKDVQLEQPSAGVAGVQTDPGKSVSDDFIDTETQSRSSSSTWDSSELSSLRSCSCCKRKNVTAQGLSYLRRKLSDQVAPLCKPCYRHYRNLPPNHGINFYNNPQHVCRCYTMIQTDTLNEIKRTIDELDELDRHCTCTNPSTRNRDVDYCRHCKCKLKRTSKSKSGIAYMLTFENRPITKNDDEDYDGRSKKKPLEEIKIKIPVIPKRKKDKVNKKRKERKSCESESSSNRESRHRQRQEVRTITLQEHLIQNRPEFVQVAEERRKTLLDSIANREQDKGKKRLLILQNNIQNDGEITERRSTNEDHKRLFSAREMKEITKKHYKNLPEVQRKLVDNRERQIRMANRLIADTFNEKLRQNVLKGKPSLPTDEYVVNL